MENKDNYATFRYNDSENKWIPVIDEIKTITINGTIDKELFNELKITKDNTHTLMEKWNGGSRIVKAKCNGIKEQIKVYTKRKGKRYIKRFIKEYVVEFEEIL